MKKILIFILVFAFTMNTTNAWLGLTAQVGDLLNISKWNEMIDKLNTKLDQSNIVGSSNIEVNNSGTGVIISLTGSVSASSIPYITSGSKTITTSTTQNINITGLNFVPSTTVSIPGWPGTINSTTINSPTDLDVNITASTNTGTYDFVISNSTVQNTIWSGNGVGQLNVFSPSLWKDLRLGGDVFTFGNGAGNNIRYRSGMNMLRDANGMYFTGSTPWSSWVKFESLDWTRGQNKTLEFVFTNPTATMMIGIGSTATNETSTAQYAQAEVQIYFQNSTTMWGLYGNNGTIGTAGNQSNTTSISGCASQVFKEKFTNDGTNGSSVLTLYCLPSANQIDWDNTANVLKTFTVGGTLNPAQTNIMPFIIPTNGGTQRFIAVKVN